MPRRPASKNSKKPRSSNTKSPTLPQTPKSKQEYSLDSTVAEKRYSPWLESIPDQKYSSPATRLHDEIIAFVSYITETPEEKALVTHVRKLASATLRKPFKNCEILVFGSTDTGLRLSGSDIDLIINATDISDAKGKLMKLSGLLRAEPWCKSAFAIVGARVPIITFSTTSYFGSLKLDAGINNLEGVKTGEFVKARLREMPALRPLVLLIKRALAQRHLNDAAKSGISSFAVICMCAFFIQLNPQQLPQDHLSEPLSNKTLGIILSGFLEYYSQTLVYQEKYISVSRGCLLPKSTASWISSEWADSLVIQCPCTPERNITGTLSARNFDKIRGIFAHVHRIIEAATATSQSILDPLVSVDAKFIAYREHVRVLVRSGKFEDSNEAPGSGPPSGVGSSSVLSPPTIITGDLQSPGHASDATASPKETRRRNVTK